MKRVVKGFALVGLVGVAGCRPPLTQEECGDLLDRYTEKVIDQSRPSASAGQRARLLSEARRMAKRDPEFAECALRISRGQYECAMEAATADAIERCLL